MREASVLHATAEVVFVWLLLEGERHLLWSEGGWCALGSHGLAVLGVYNLEQSGGLVEYNLCLAAGEGDFIALLSNLQAAHLGAWIVHQDVSLRLCLRVSHHATVVVFKDSEDVLAVEVNCHSAVVGEAEFYGCWVDS